MFPIANTDASPKERIRAIENNYQQRVPNPSCKIGRNKHCDQSAAKTEIMQAAATCFYSFQPSA